MISLATIEELLRHEHTLGLYCGTCDRWDTADLGRLVEAGKGGHPVVGLRFRCRACGARADKQVRPPVPSPVGAVAYI